MAINFWSVEDISTTTGKKGKDKKVGSEGTKTRKSLSYTIVCFIVIAALVVVSVCGVNINSAYMSVSMHFAEISEGLNPDRSPFDADEILCDEVLERAAEKLGGKMDAEALKKHLSVSGITAEGSIAKIKQNVLDSSGNYSYFPNRYNITYTVVSESVKKDGPLAIAGAVLEQLVLPGKGKVLEAVSEAYSEYYEDTYVIGDEILTPDWEKVKELDHFNRVQAISNKIARMSRYLNTLYDENVSFEASSGESFGDLNAELSRISSVDLENYKAYIIQNGITLDKANLLKQLRYVKFVNNESFRRNSAEHKVMLDGINIYDPNVTKVVFIPALDSTDEFYMSRTQIGIDYLTNRAETARLSANDAQNTELYYDYLIKQFTNAPDANQTVISDADMMAEGIMAKVDEFSKRAMRVNDEFLKSAGYEGVVNGGVGYGIGVVGSCKMAIRITVILVALFYVLYQLNCFRKARKLRKEEA